MKSIFALLGLAKYALANVYMSRDERLRVHGSARKNPWASVFAAAQSAAAALASDLRTIGLLCVIGMRNLRHDATAAVAKVRSKG